MTDLNKSAVIIFAKYPYPGKVKTRLAAEMGNDFAINFYRTCSRYIFKEVSYMKKLGIDCYLFYGTEDEVSDTRKWVGENFIYNPQIVGDLGQKMSSAFQNVFSSGKKKVLILGTDIPDISKEDLIKAFDNLDNCDVVISPSHDGGYNYLGTSKYLPDLFENIIWSTNEVFQKTINKITELKLSYCVGESLNDIDDKSDLMKWLSETDSGNVVLKKDVLAMMENK